MNPPVPAASRPMLAQGRVYFWQGGSLWIGRGEGRSQWHAHHAHQIALPLEDECFFRSEAEGAWAAYPAAIVPSHCKHQFEIKGTAMAQLFVEPETAQGRALSRRFAAGIIAPIPEADRRRMVALLSGSSIGGTTAEQLPAEARAAISVLAGPTPARSGIDARVGKAIEYVHSRFRSPVSLADAAAVACLSSGRFRHLFMQETGSSFRAYLLWLRINAAIEASMAGASWTQAAHESGFADSAHLTRTFARMFGMNPASLVSQPLRSAG